MAISRWLDLQLPRFLDDLRVWTAVDSGTHHRPGLDTMADLVAGRLAALGCHITRYPCQGYGLGDCVAGTLRGRGRLRLLLMGHMDTVYPDGTAAMRPLQVENGHAIGPGTCDMKGGLLAGLYALEALQGLRFQDFAEITFFCNSDEEINSPCSRQHYLPLARQADAVLVLEAGWPRGILPFGALTVARKGGGRFELQVGGAEAHAGAEFERGASAILALAKKVEALSALTGRWPGVTVNVGIVRGGATYNTVAAWAHAEVDVRIGRSEDIAAVESAIDEIVSREDVPGTCATLKGGIVKPPMEPSASAALARLAHQEAAVLGFKLAEFASGGTSDANFIAPAGVPVLDGLGPVGAKDHSPDEYLVIDSIVPRIALVVRLIAALARQPRDHGHTVTAREAGRPQPIG